jgi:cysteine-rich repeat protein
MKKILLLFIILINISIVSALDYNSINDGDYLTFEGHDWIMLNKSSGYMIYRGSVGSMDFDAISKGWYYSDGSMADLNIYLNNQFYDSINGDNYLLEKQWDIGQTYTWTGKIGLLSLNEFNDYRSNGPTLNGVTQKVIETYLNDKHMGHRWWLITAANSGNYVRTIDYGSVSMERPYRNNIYVRPTAYLKNDINIISGTGTEIDPWMIPRIPVIVNTNLSIDINNPTKDFYNLNKIISVEINTNNLGSDIIDDFYLGDFNLEGLDCGKFEESYISQAENTICSKYSSDKANCNITLADTFNYFDDPAIYYGCFYVEGVWYKSEKSYLEISTSCGDTKISGSEVCEAINNGNGDCCSNDCNTLNDCTYEDILEGDYLQTINLAGKYPHDWIMLDSSEGYMIHKGSIGSMNFDGPYSLPMDGSSSWDEHDVSLDDYNGISDLNIYLNREFYSNLGGDGYLIQGDWELLKDPYIGNYIWSGKIGLLTESQFETYNTNGPDLHGSTQKVINYYPSDNHMNSPWWLITSRGGNFIYRVDGNRLSSGYVAHPNEVRPTAYLNKMIRVTSGDGSEGAPWIIGMQSSLEFCGDVRRQRPNSLGNMEECDMGFYSGNRDEGSCLYNCSYGFCGDGYIVSLSGWVPLEGCDDGNTINGDGCSSNCQIEYGYSCMDELVNGPSPSLCFPICGDGLINGDEECDDNNTNNWDGCTSNCKFQVGYNCSEEPSLCSPICGDERIVGDEECDDGNTINGDGCSSECVIESEIIMSLSLSPDNSNPTINTYELNKNILTNIIIENLESYIIQDFYLADNTLNDDCDNSYSHKAQNTVCLQSLSSDTINCNITLDENFNNFDTSIGYYGCTKIASVWYNSTAGYLKIESNCSDEKLSGSETCDDGNLVEGDGCDLNCQVEDYYGCNTYYEPSSCSPTHGDGHIIGDEECDDGCTSPGVPAGCDAYPLNNNDGCTVYCAIEIGYICNGEPSVCTTICGDDLKKGDEECDDGNLVNGDGCTSDCLREVGLITTLSSDINNPTTDIFDEFNKKIPLNMTMINLGPDQIEDFYLADYLSVECNDAHLNEAQDTTCSQESLSLVGCNITLTDDFNTFDTTLAYYGCSKVEGQWYRSNGYLEIENTPQGVHNGDYVSVSNTQWIMLDYTEGYVISKNNVLSNLRFDDDYNRWDQSEIKSKLNDEFYNSINEGDLYFINKIWDIETYYGGSYEWTGRIGLLSLNEFDDYHINGPNLRDSTQKVIDYANYDKHSPDGWFLISPSSVLTKSKRVSLSSIVDYSVYDAYAGNSYARPTAYLNADLIVTGGEGSIVAPWVLSSFYESPLINISLSQNINNPTRESYELDKSILLNLTAISLDSIVITDFYLADYLLDNDCDDTYNHKAENTFCSKYNDNLAECSILLDGDFNNFDTLLFYGCMKVNGVWYNSSGGYLKIESLCGNDVINYGEECDDGGMVNGDGCSSSCAIELGYACSGEPSSCITDCGDRLIRGDEECDDGCISTNYPVGCDNDPLSNNDGCDSNCYDERCGNSQVQPWIGEVCDDGINDGSYGGCESDCQDFGPHCGDGTPNYANGEGCDDGNNINTDNCLNDCSDWSCGDGFVNPIYEVCDDGINDGSYGGCQPGCQAFGFFCGDGTLNYANGEECDDGNNINTDNCLNDCSDWSCGDGYINYNQGEVCDDKSHNGEYGYCNLNCDGLSSFCGDGTPNDANGEECDDGNNVNIDHCLISCVNNTCGDGFILDGVETCDDGPLNGEYGLCNSLCTGIGFNCGDGMPDYDEGEQCDDNNSINTDKCLNNCQWARCGDNIKWIGTEVCDDGDEYNGQYGHCGDCYSYASHCGDGINDSDYEECDDGDGININNCTNNCKVAFCGDGIILDGNEICDDGPNNGLYGYCNLLCSGFSIHCGDRNIDYDEGEQCDDGNNINNDNCTNKCQSARCDDGIVWAGYEVCDSGVNNGDYGKCNSQCSGLGPHCGDENVNVPYEQCDDDDNDNTDWCPNNCQYAHCGDGFVREYVETCDSGDNNGQYGYCNVFCNGDSSHCGDGILDLPYEDCDPSNWDLGGYCNLKCEYSYCGDGFVTGHHYNPITHHYVDSEVCDTGITNSVWYNCNDDCMGWTPNVVGIADIKCAEELDIDVLVDLSGSMDDYSRLYQVKNELMGGAYSGPDDHPISPSNSKGFINQIINQERPNSIGVHGFGYIYNGESAHFEQDQSQSSINQNVGYLDGMSTIGYTNYGAGFRGILDNLCYEEGGNCNTINNDSDIVIFVSDGLPRVCDDCGYFSSDANFYSSYLSGPDIYFPHYYCDSGVYSGLTIHESPPLAFSAELRMVQLCPDFTGKLMSEAFRLANQFRQRGAHLFVIGIDAPMGYCDDLTWESANEPILSYSDISIGQASDLLSCPEVFLKKLAEYGDGMYFSVRNDEYAEYMESRATRSIEYSYISYLLQAQSNSMSMDEVFGSIGTLFQTNLSYFQIGAESPIDIEKCFEGSYTDYDDFCSSPSNNYITNIEQYECGACKFINDSVCRGSDLGECSFYPLGENCSGAIECNADICECDGIGNCISFDEICDNGIDDDFDDDLDWDNQLWENGAVVESGIHPWHGDDNCAVGVNNISISKLNPVEDTLIEVGCNVTVANISSVDAHIYQVGHVESCEWTKWEGNTAFFDCNVTDRGFKEIVCSINLEKSYQILENETTQINVMSSNEICDNGIDDDHDLEWDWDTLDRGPWGDIPNHGDDNCSIGVSSIDVSDTTPYENSIIEVNCTSTVPGVNSVDAFISNTLIFDPISATACSDTSWNGDIVSFDCDVGAGGIKSAICIINTSRSYQDGLNQSLEIDVQFCGDGDIHLPEETCEPPNTATCDANCHWVISSDGFKLDFQPASDGQLQSGWIEVNKVPYSGAGFGWNFANIDNIDEIVQGTPAPATYMTDLTDTYYDFHRISSDSEFIIDLTSLSTLSYSVTIFSGAKSQSNGPFDFILEEGTTHKVIARDIGSTPNGIEMESKVIKVDDGKLNIFFDHKGGDIALAGIIVEGFCGNGDNIDDPSNEECDDGDESDLKDGTESGSCIIDTTVGGLMCQNAICGDGYLSSNGTDGILGTADDEECDDGDLDNGDGCNSDCKVGCILENVTIELDVDDGLASPLDDVKISGIINNLGNCSDADHIQVDANDILDECRLEWLNGDMKGIYNSSIFLLKESTNFEVFWQVPSIIHDDCLGKTVRPSGAALWDPSPDTGGVWMDGAENLDGFLTFPNSVCGDNILTGSEDCSDEGATCPDTEYVCNDGLLSGNITTFTCNNCQCENVTIPDDCEVDEFCNIDSGRCESTTKECDGPWNCTASLGECCYLGDCITSLPDGITNASIDQHDCLCGLSRGTYTPNPICNVSTTDDPCWDVSPLNDGDRCCGNEDYETWGREQSTNQYLEHILILGYCDDSNWVSREGQFTHYNMWVR